MNAGGDTRCRDPHSWSCDAANGAAGGPFIRTGERALTGCAGAAAGPPKTEAAARSVIAPRVYRSIGEVIMEDTAPLAVYFPQFSPALWDPEIGLWYREGSLRPLRAWPATYIVRMYYQEVPEALPLLCVSPTLHPRAPRMWLNVRNRRRVRSLCYTYAPDGTVVRGRNWDDKGAEVLRQDVMWLLRYIV